MSQARAKVKSATQKTVPHPPLPVDGAGSFSNLHLIGAVLFTPWLLIQLTPFVHFGFKTYLFYLIITGLPVTSAYWLIASAYSGRVNTLVNVPNRPQSDYIVFNDATLREKYLNRKIPMQVFHDAYFEGKVDIKGDMLEVLEYRHDWANFNFTWALLKYVFTVLIPDVLVHSRSQDEEQVRDHYDRGDDFYEWFLGPRMIYTSGVISDPDVEESLEQLQDNKLALVCHKIDLQPEDKLLDFGCGWGTLCAFAAKNYGCDVTGVTLGRNQTKFATDRLRKNGVPESQGRILCMDVRDIPKEPRKRFTKITSLEQIEHIGLIKYSAFLREVYELLDDDGVFFLQCAGIRPSWQYEDLVWGLFMNKYIFPGADASMGLNWVVNKLEAARFEVKSVDVLGVHYSATIWRWYKNWISNKDKVIAKYGERWYRIWYYFLAASTITARQGGASVWQITLKKNINYVQRIGRPEPFFVAYHAYTDTLFSFLFRPVE